MSLKTFARLLSTSLVLISLVQHEVAFAAGESTKLVPSVRLQQAAAARAKRIKTPDDLPSSLDVVKEAKTRTLSKYLAGGGSGQQIAALHADLMAVINANHRVGFVDNRQEFEEWFSKNETAIIMAAQKSDAMTLQTIVVESYLSYVVTTGEEKRDLPGVVLQLQDLIQHPATIVSGGLAAAYGTFAFVRDIVKGAAVAGPGAGIVGAILEPWVRPVRERAAVIGNRLLGDSGTRLANRLNAERDGMIETRSQIEAREAARAATAQIMARRGFEMNAAQAHENMENLKENWNKSKQIWESTYTGGLRDGRAYTSDNLILRPNALVDTLLSAVVGREVFKISIDATLDRMLLETTDKARMTELTMQYRQAIKAEHHAEANDKKNAKAKSKAVQTLRAELTAMGASAYNLDSINQAQRSELALYRQAALTLASSALYELMYPEFNRELPPELAKAYDAFKSHYCFDFFEAEYRSESAKILNQLGLELKEAKSKINADIASKEAEIKAVEEKAPKRAEAKPAREARISVVELRTHRPVLIPLRTAKQAPSAPTKRVSTKPAEPRATDARAETAKPSQAVEALKGYVASDSNRAAAAGSEQLKPGKKKTFADRAREAAARAARK